VVQDGSSSGSEDESGEADGDILDDDKSDKKSIHPGHARDIDSEGKVICMTYLAALEGGCKDVGVEAKVDETVLGCRKSKRLKVPPKSLLGAYACDKRLLNQVRQAV
ncbi:unnamed protein product, partial [Brassica rapa]